MCTICYVQSGLPAPTEHSRPTGLETRFPVVSNLAAFILSGAYDEFKVAYAATYSPMNIWRTHHHEELEEINREANEIYALTHSKMIAQTLTNRKARALMVKTGFIEDLKK